MAKSGVSTSAPPPGPGIARAAATKKSSALFLLACIFLATGILRANEVRRDLASLLAPPANAATGAGAHASGPPSDIGQTNPATSENRPTPAMNPPPDLGAGDAGRSSAGHADTADPSHLHPGSDGKATPNSADRCLTGAFLAAALEREQELAAMSLQIDSRRRELEVTEKRVAAQVAELLQQQNALATAFGQADAAAEQEAMQLVSIYEKMKPKQAAQIFDQMPPEVGAGFVRRMRQTSSAQIMANMEPQKAYAISLLLAGRSSSVRKQ